MAVEGYFADEILRRFSLSTVWAGHLRRSFSALVETTSKRRDEGYGVWKTRFVPCPGHCGPGTRRTFKFGQVGSSFVTLVF